MNEKKLDYKITGLEKEEYDKQASSHSKANIVLWIIGGIAFSIYNGSLISLSTILLLIPGIFIISFASMLTFFVNLKKQKIVPKTNNVLVLSLFTVWYLIDLAFPLILSISYVLLIEYLLIIF